MWGILGFIRDQNNNHTFAFVLSLFIATFHYYYLRTLEKFGLKKNKIIAFMGLSPVIGYSYRKTSRLNWFAKMPRPVGFALT